MIPKFRAYLKLHKKIVDVQEINYKYKEIVWVNGKYTEVDNFGDIELLQSTGLFDKNGVEVYEGDIINYKVEVESDNGSLYTLRELTGYIYKEGNCMWVKLNDYEIIPLWCLKDKNATINILGNIYEHPHLLEEE